MKKTMKKVLALVLTVLMCVSVALPVVAADATCPGANADHTKANCSWTEIEKVAVGCGQDGYTLNKCNTCSKYFHDDIVPTTKNHEIKTGASVKPSCTQQGYDICKHCGAKFNIVEGSGEGHRYADFTAANKGVGKAWYPIATGKDCSYTKWESVCLNNWDNKGTNEGANCTAKATKTYDGTLDNHEWKLVSVITAPTCSVAGSGNFKCDVCSLEKVLEIAPTENHKFTVYLNAKAATCTEDGNSAGYACAECGAYQYDNMHIEAGHQMQIDVNGHKDATCTTAGYTLWYCTVCGENEADVEPPLGHNRGELVDYVAATCVAPGSRTYEHACTNTWEDENGNPASCNVGATDPLPQLTTHTFSPVTHAPTCQTPGYTQLECQVEGCVAVSGGQTNPVPVDPTNHEWNEEILIPATCTTDGQKTRYCVCGAHEDAVVIPKLNHKYYTLDSNNKKTSTKTPTVVAPNCVDGDGYVVWDCIQCAPVAQGETQVQFKDYDANKNNVVLSIFNAADQAKLNAGLKYDVTKTAHHDFDMALGVNGVLGTDRGNDCTTVAYNKYFCKDCQKLVPIAIEGTGAHLRPATGIYAGSDYDKSDATCTAKGYAEFWPCDRDGCEYWEGAQTKNGEYVYAAGSTIPKRIEYAALGHKNYVAAKNPTCTDTGYKATWDCDRCNTKSSTTDADYVTPALGHDYGNGEAGTQAEEWKVKVTATKCGEYSYTQLVCSRCKADKITGYAYMDHTWSTTLTPATCEKGSFYACTFAGCTAEKAVDPKLGHIDADGNVIKCATAENFKCYRTCCADSDATTNCNKTSNSWLTTHNFVNTKFEATCTNYSYDLYVCVDCEYNYRVVHDGDEFQLAAHQWKAQSGKTLYTGAAYSGDEQLNLVAADGYYITTTAAPGTAGVLTRICKECSKTETLNYGAQLYYNISIDNGVVAGAQLVNSGLLKVTLKTTATNLSVWSLKFRLSFDEKVLAYHSYRIMNNAFETGTIVATENIPDVNPNPADTTFVDLPEIVNVIMTAPNNAAAEKQDVTLNGNMQGLIEVYFRVLSNVGYNAAANTGVGGSAKVTVDEVQVVTAANVNYKADPVKSDNKIGGDNYDQKTIYMLGDVTNDAITSTSVASLLDASALMDFYKAEKYNAMADIDKNGKVDLADFAALMTYIADGKYNVLVANGVN